MQIQTKQNRMPDYARARSMSKGRRSVLRKTAGDALKYLRDSGLEYREFNNGLHYRVESNVDYWPTSGIWIDLNDGMKRWGVKNLVVWCKTMGYAG